MKEPVLVILAAGMGSRYGGLKQIDTVGSNGESIIDFSIYDAIRAGFKKVMLIIREEHEEALTAVQEEALLFRQEEENRRLPLQKGLFCPLGCRL